MWRWGIIFALLFTCACSSQTTTPTRAFQSWDDGPFVERDIGPTFLVSAPSPGRHVLTVRYARPLEATAMFVTVSWSFRDARSGGALLVDRDSRFPLTTLPNGEAPIDVRYDVVEPFLAYTPIFGDSEQLVRRVYRDNAPNVVAGVVLLTCGTFALLALLLSRRRGAPPMWLAAFALAAGASNLALAPGARSLVIPWLGFWRAANVVAVAAQFAAFGMLVDTLFSLRDRLLRVLVALSCFVAVLWFVLLVADVPMTLLARRLLYVVLAFGAADVALRVARRARDGDDTARVFIAGFALMIGLTLPDLVWGAGIQLLPFNTSPFGVIVFAMFVAFILERRFRSQHDALESRTTQVQRLNTELRRQIATRSRELASVISDPSLRPSTSLHEGSVLAQRYTLREKLGEGGMGTVYRAERKMGDAVDLVAIKVMAGSTSPDDAARFAREAEIASQLDHENLVTVHDVGFEAGTLFLVMELVDGASLEDIRERFGDVELALPILAHVARGLEALHAAKVVHRDLKPGNVLVTRTGVAKISDFGISMRASLGVSSDAIAVTEKRLTQAGAVMGTPLYMAPETMRGAALADARADVFAFGVVAYEMLTAARPFHVAPALSVVVTGTLPPPPTLASLGLIAPDLAELLDRCILQDPDARPTAAELAAALTAATPRAGRSPGSAARAS